MKNGIFTLDWASVGDALVSAAFFAVIAALYQIVTTSGFSLFDAHWLTIGENMANVGFTAAVVSLVKNFNSTTEGSVLGIAPNTAATTAPND
jgi:hypothetical protein